MQFVEKTSKIFDFDSIIELFIAKKSPELGGFLKRACDAVGMKVEEKAGQESKVLWSMINRYGVRLSGPFLGLRKREKGFTITHSVFNCLERLIALMMEAKGLSFEERVKDIAKKTKFE